MESWFKEIPLQISPRFCWFAVCRQTSVCMCDCVPPWQVRLVENVTRNLFRKDVSFAFERQECGISLWFLEYYLLRYRKAKYKIWVEFLIIWRLEIIFVSPTNFFAHIENGLCCDVISLFSIDRISMRIKWQRDWLLTVRY